MGSSKGLFVIVLLCPLLCYAVSSAMAADCTLNTKNTINTADIMNLANDVGSNNFSPPIDSPLGFSPTSTHAVGLGTALFCIRNRFIAAGTHITLSDIQFGANDIVSQCCPSGSPTCQGGQFTIRGDTGITVELNVVPVTESCDP